MAKKWIVGPAYPCPSCGARTYTKDSRPERQEAMQIVRRRRHCSSCGLRMTTIERLALDPHWTKLPHTRIDPPLTTPFYDFCF